MRKEKTLKLQRLKNLIFRTVEWSFVVEGVGELTLQTENSLLEFSGGEGEEICCRRRALVAGIWLSKIMQQVVAMQQCCSTAVWPSCGYGSSGRAQVGASTSVGVVQLASVRTHGLSLCSDRFRVSVQQRCRSVSNSQAGRNTEELQVCLHVLEWVGRVF